MTHDTLATKINLQIYHNTKNKPLNDYPLKIPIKNHTKTQTSASCIISKGWYIFCVILTIIIAIPLE